MFRTSMLNQLIQLGRLMLEASTSAAKTFAKITEKSSNFTGNKVDEDKLSDSGVKKMFDEEAMEDSLEAPTKTWTSMKRPRKTLAKKSLEPRLQSSKLYAKAASSIGYKVLYVHSGVKDRDPIKKFFFDKWDQLAATCRRFDENYFVIFALICNVATSCALENFLAKIQLATNG